MLIVSDGSCKIPCITKQLQMMDNLTNVALRSLQTRQNCWLENFFSTGSKVKVKIRSVYGLLLYIKIHFQALEAQQWLKNVQKDCLKSSCTRNLKLAACQALVKPSPSLVAIFLAPIHIHLATATKSSPTQLTFRGYAYLLCQSESSHSAWYTASSRDVLHVYTYMQNLSFTLMT